MSKTYIYIDESGDLGLSERSSKVLVISALVTVNANQLDRIIKNARRNKFKKELKKAYEIKFNSSSQQLKEYLIGKLNNTSECKGFHCILYKNRIFSNFLKENKQKLYNYVSGALAKSINIQFDEVEVRVDKSKRKQFLRDDFDSYFKSRLREGSKIGEINIYHSSSENFSGIQLVDLLAGSAYLKYNNNNTHFVDLINKETFPQCFKEVWSNN